MAFCATGILFEDFPGLAKTMIAKGFAAASGCEFRRVQFTPDLLPVDITGTYVLNQSSAEFESKSGPIFTNNCWEMRSTGHHQRPGLHCSNRCRRDR